MTRLRFAGVRFIQAMAPAMFVAVLSACSPQGAPLAGDQLSTSKCPPGGCADAAPDVDQLTITGIPSGNLQQKIQLNGSSQIIDMIEFGGECYASTYPDNRIEVRVYANGGTSPMTNISQSSDVVSGSQTQTTPKCIKGRYNVALNGNKLPAGSYRVQLELVGVDTDGDHRNASTGVASVNVSRY